MNDVVKPIETTVLIVNEIRTLRQEVSDATHALTHDGKRNTDTVFGFEPNPQFQHFYSMYKRNGFAKRVIAGVAARCWQAGFTIKSDKKEILTDEMASLFNKRKLLANIEKTDILNRLGRYSLMYVGIQGQKPEEPLRKTVSGDLSKVFFSPFGEDGIIVNTKVTDPLDERFGLPLTYDVRVIARDNNQELVDTSSRIVHWSRVVHLAEGSLDNDIEGESALKDIYNALQSIIKTNYSAAEAYFRNAHGRIVLEVDKAYASDITTTEKESMTKELEAYQHEMKDFMRLAGATAKPINTPQFDPVGTFNVNIQEISASTGIPVRILTGEGGGQYAGNEDKASYNAVIADRQTSFCTPVMFRVLEILEEAGLIDLPDNAVIEFPIAKAVNEVQESEIIHKKASALNQAAQAIGIGGGLEGEMSAKQFIEDIMNMTYEPIEIDHEDDDGDFDIKGLADGE